MMNRADREFQHSQAVGLDWQRDPERIIDVLNPISMQMLWSCKKQANGLSLVQVYYRLISCDRTQFDTVRYLFPTLQLWLVR